MPQLNPNPALAVLRAVVESQDLFEGEQDSMLFIRLWYEGAFDSCREYWPDLPDDVYIGADPLFQVDKTGVLDQPSQ